MDYFRPEVSGSPNLCDFRLIVLARGPGFRGLRVPGQCVVLGEDIYVYCMLGCMFWVVSDLVLPLKALVLFGGLCRVFVDYFVWGCKLYIVCDVWERASWDVFHVPRGGGEFCGAVCWEGSAASLL